MGRSEAKLAQWNMNRRVEFRAEAAIEFADAARWYNQKQRGLGDEFERRVHHLLESIDYMPESFPVVFQRARRAKVRQAILGRFPYSLIFNYDDTHILIFAVQHLHRDSADLMRRISG